MINEKTFLKEIELVLNEISDNRFSDLGKYYCETEQCDFYPTNINETSFTEKIVRRLSYLEDVIGWKVNYPQDVYTDSKVPLADLAFNYIAEHYFESVVKVRNWDGHEDTHYSILHDILKLYTYESKDYRNAGKNRYMVVLYTGTSNDKEEIAGIVNYFFVAASEDTLNNGGKDLSDSLEKFAIANNWSQQNVDLLFSTYGELFNNVLFVDFKEDFLLHDLKEDVFAFVLKLL